MADGSGPKGRVRLPVLPDVHRRWLGRNAIGGPAIANVTINAGLAWVAAHGRQAIPVWATPLVGGPATFTDTVGTLFFLPLITCVTITIGVHRELRQGRLTPLAPIDWLRRARIPDRLAPRAVAFALATTAVLLPIAAAGTILMGPLSSGAFIGYKAVLGVTLGAVITPILALCAMTDSP